MKSVFLKPMWFSRVITLGIILWVFIGIAYGSTSWELAEDLGNYYRQIPADQDSRLYLYGSDFLMYQALTYTPLNTRILYVIPDMNNYPARATYFLYPRQITFVATFEQALQQNLQNFDYAMVHVNTPQYSGYIGGLNYLQGKFWTTEGFLTFINLLQPQAHYSNTDLEQLIAQSHGNFLYQINGSGL